MKNIENIVTDLETSRQLQEAGIECETAFVWIEVSITEKKEIPVLARDMTLTSDCMVSKKGTKWILQYNNSYSNNKIIPAFTAGEMMQVLPEKIVKNEVDYKLNVGKENGVYFANYVSVGELLSPDFDGKLFETALAKLCLWCKKEGYL